MVFGLPPFYSSETDQIYYSILNEQLTFPDNIRISSDLKDLLRQLLQKNPNCRIGQVNGVMDILSHRWFADVDPNDLLNQRLVPPYVPNPIKFNFDEEEFAKGDCEFRE